MFYLYTGSKLDPEGTPGENWGECETPEQAFEIINQRSHMPGQWAQMVYPNNYLAAVLEYKDDKWSVLQSNFNDPLVLLVASAHGKTE